MFTIIAIIFFYIAPIVLTIKTASLCVFLLTIGIWIIDTVVLLFYCSWWDQVGSTTPKLSYRAFIKLYNVMPEDFSFNEYDFYYKNTVIDFKTFSDWWRYRKFYKNIEKHKTEQEQLQRQAALISELQRGLTQEQIKVDDFIKEKLNEQAQIFSGN
jgi:hypothetical protein